MPRIAEFYGIVVAIYYNDHEPPHVHVSYAGARALVGIDPIVVLRGEVPRRALGLISEWAAIHQGELIDNWERARAHQPLRAIAPLD